MAAAEESKAKIGALVSVPLFSSLTLGQLEQLAGALKQRDVPEGEKVIHEGETGDEMYIVKRGALTAYKRGHGHMRRYAAGAEGAFFGELGLVKEQPRQATITATEACVLLVLSRSDVFAVTSAGKLKAALESIEKSYADALGGMAIPGLAQRHLATTGQDGQDLQERIGTSEDAKQMTAERARLLWRMLWSAGDNDQKLRINIPETSLLEDGAVRMTIFTGKDGHVMKRARQNTTIGTIKARLLTGLDDSHKNSADVPTAVIYAPAHVAPQLIDAEQLMDTCHTIQRRQQTAFADEDSEAQVPLLVQEHVPPLHDIRYAVEYHRASSTREPECHITCRRYDWRVRNVSRTTGQGSRGPEVQLTDEALIDEIGRMVSSLDMYLFQQQKARLSSLKCDFVPARSGKIYLRSFGSVAWLNPPEGWFAPGQPGAEVHSAKNYSDPPDEQVAWAATGIRPAPAKKQSVLGQAKKGVGAWVGDAAKGEETDADDKGEKEKAAEELSQQLAEELSRAQEALMQIQHSKFAAEQAHKEAMEEAENRIAQIEQDNSNRVHKLELELDRRAAMIDRLSDDMVKMRVSFEKLVSSTSEEDGSYTTYAEYDRLNSRATEIARSVDAIFTNSLEFTRQRAVMDRVIEDGRVHMEATQNAVKAIHSQLDEVKQQAAEQLRQMVEVKVRENEANVKGLALEVAEAREQIDCLGFKRRAYSMHQCPREQPHRCCLRFVASFDHSSDSSDGHGWSNVTGRPSNRKTLKMASELGKR